MLVRLWGTGGENETEPMRREKKNYCSNEVQIKEIKIHAEKNPECFFHYKLIINAKHAVRIQRSPRWLVFTIHINSKVQSDHMPSFLNRRRKMMQNSAVPLRNSAVPLHHVTTPEEPFTLYADSHNPWGTLQNWEWWAKQSKKYNKHLLPSCSCYFMTHWSSLS